MVIYPGEVTAAAATAGADLARVRHGFDPTRRLGCGNMGCVWASSRPGVVVKLTTDWDEAAFAAWATGKRLPGAGVVRYHAVFHVGRFGNAGHHVWALWRDAIRPLESTASPGDAQAALAGAQAAHGDLQRALHLVGTSRYFDLEPWRQAYYHLEKGEVAELSALRSTPPDEVVAMARAGRPARGPGGRRIARIRKALLAYEGALDRLLDMPMAAALGTTLLHLSGRNIWFGDLKLDNLGRRWLPPHDLVLHDAAPDLALEPLDADAIPGLPTSPAPPGRRWLRTSRRPRERRAR
jgi:hypothetical protein